MQAFGWWEEAGENPQTHGENMPTERPQPGTEPGTLLLVYQSH